MSDGAALSTTVGCTKSRCEPERYKAPIVAESAFEAV